MTDDKPDLTTTEVRQGNSRKMNTRALVYGLIALIIIFALVLWFSIATYDETPTTVGGGTTIDDVAPAPDEVETELDELPTPAPETEPAAGEAAAPVEEPAPEVEAAPAEPEAPAAP